jgi:hypothetical protein
MVAQGLAAGLQKELIEYYRLVAVLQVACVSVCSCVCMHMHVCGYVCISVLQVACVHAYVVRFAHVMHILNTETCYLLLKFTISKCAMRSKITDK